MTILYDILFALAFVLYFPVLLWRGKWHPGFAQRFGLFSIEDKAALCRRPNIWIHAVSVGEILAIDSTIKELKERFEGHTIVLSTVTQTGHQLAREKFAGQCIILWAPLDFSWVVKKFIETINPRVYIAAETEIWPNLYGQLHKQKVPVVQINGRISDRSFSKYKLVQWLTKSVLKDVCAFCMQSQQDVDRIIALGAPAERALVAGNLKFDSPFETKDLPDRDQSGFTPYNVLLVGASTHPGEEEILLDIYKKLAPEMVDLRLILAPRHVERASSVADLVIKSRLNPVYYSGRGLKQIDSKSVLILDTIGHLRSLYGISDIVFIGKTLRVGGGQNMIEPAAYGTAVILGPLTQNFKDVVRLFLNEQAMVQVAGELELEQSIRTLLKNPSQVKDLGRKAKEVVKKARGATAKTIKIIEGILV